MASKMWVGAWFILLVLSAGPGFAVSSCGDLATLG